MMQCYDFIFIVLVYRNTDDVIEFIDSVRDTTKNSRIIIVNSYYNDNSMKKVREIAHRYDCDFINVENKGYSYGNNEGISYASQKYQYKYLVISNPDIIIRKFIFDPDCDGLGDIIAPHITTTTGKKQNPMIVKQSKSSEWLIYTGFKYHIRLFLFSGIILNKIKRYIDMRHRSSFLAYPIYCAHGSFVLLSSHAIEKLGPRPYDENMFLFAEESVLAYKAQEHGLKTLFFPNIRVYHKEDGSVKLSNISVNQELAKSNIYFYEHYVRGV